MREDAFEGMERVLGTVQDRQGVPQGFAGGQVVGSVTDGRLEKREALHRGEPRNLRRRPQVSGSPALGHAHVARGVSPLLLGHQRPMEVHQRGFPRLTRCVPRALGHRAGQAAEDPVVGRRRVRDVRDGRARHVARDAVVALPPGLPLGQRQGAALFCVALETTLAVIRDLRARRRQAVRVVAGDAAKLTLARGETATCCHLLDMPDRLELALVSLLHQEYRQEPVDRQARAVVERLAARAGEAERALEMALLTDRIP